MTQIQYPDGTFATYQYDSTFHLVTADRGCAEPLHNHDL